MDYLGINSFIPHILMFKFIIIFDLGKHIISCMENKALIGGISFKSIMIVKTEKKHVTEVQYLNKQQRIRDLLYAEEGSIWVLEDGKMLDYCN